MTKKSPPGGDGPLCEFSALCCVNYACWFISSLKVVSFFSHFRFRQYSFNSLFFQSNIAHVVHQFFVFAVELDNFFDLRTQKPSLRSGLSRALRQLSAARWCGIPSPSSRPTTTRRFACSSNSSRGSSRACFFVATETLCSLTTQNVIFAVDQRSRYVDVVSFTRP